jgi:hypothetical protein
MTFLTIFFTILLSDIMLSVDVLGVFLLGVGCAEFLHAGFHDAGISFFWPQS